jgi:antitoxin (DNA-binding transcriptional repressor) of toxin-antitoxin stability system
MVFVPFSELKIHSGKFLDLVDNGETVVITRHGRPVAQMGRFDPGAAYSVQKTWQRPVRRITIKGESLSTTISRLREED